MSAPSACRWCSASLAGGKRLPGRIRCRDCGVATTSPWPTAAELDAAYAGPYRPAAGRFSGWGDALLRRSRGALATRLDEIAPPGAVLDVGAGDGALLAALRRRGRVAIGGERDPAAPARVGGLEAEAGAEEWAAVVFWHSLEHLPDPAGTLAAAAERLRPEGVILIAAPNADSLQARLFGRRWLALDPPRHLHHFTAESLVERLRALGLRIERVSYLRGGQVVFGWLHGLVAELPDHPDLYDAIRRPAARFHRLSARRRLATLLAGGLLLPLALLGTAAEVALRRGGTVYLEARSGA
ncbi:MAG: class I SAM-dependent methyltransferase [Solirubrobacterales bacterium]